MDFNEFRWIPMGFGGFRWILVDSDGFRWVPMDFDGFWWISQFFNEKDACFLTYLKSDEKSLHPHIGDNGCCLYGVRAGAWLWQKEISKSAVSRAVRSVLNYTYRQWLPTEAYVKSWVAVEVWKEDDKRPRRKEKWYPFRDRDTRSAMNSRNNETRDIICREEGRAGGWPIITKLTTDNSRSSEAILFHVCPCGPLDPHIIIDCSEHLTVRTCTLLHEGKRARPETGRASHPRKLRPTWTTHCGKYGIQ